MRIEIIAEAGINHNADLLNAYRLVDMAKNSGADTIKFQTSVPELEAIADAPVCDYQRAIAWTSQLEMLRAVTLPFPQTKLLARYCESVANIEFMSTPADPVSLKFLIEECGMRRIKLGSDNLNNPQMLHAAGSYGVPIILSTGMATLEEIGAAIAILPAACRLSLMQCTSSYPTKLQDANLLAIKTLRGAFAMPVGFSDHTLGEFAAMIAVGAGATFIEKHITLDRDMAGPDQSMSMDPIDFACYVEVIRKATIALGHGEKIPTLGERDIAAVVRKSLVAGRPISAGEEFNADNIAVKRPGTGRNPMDYFSLIGKPALRDYRQDEMID